MNQLVAQLHPFKVATDRFVVPEGLTLAEMMDLCAIDPIMRTHAHVWIGDQYIPRDLWRVVRPKPDVPITLKVVPQGGGGGGGGKNPLRAVMTIAIIVASIYFPPLAAAGMGFNAGTVGFTVASAFTAAAITIGGTFLMDMVAPIRPPTIGDLSGAGGGSSTQDSPTLSIEGARNQLRPFSTVPVVLGVHRHVPPLGAKSYTEIIGEDHYARILVVWGYGPLKIENIKIGETSIDDFEGVQIETREGRDSDDPITLFPDQVIQDDFSILLEQTASWQTRTSQPDCDELSVDITFPNGLVYFDDSGGRSSRSVTVEIEYRSSGGSPAAPWTAPTYTATTGGTVAGSAITFTHNRTGAIRHGFRWAVATRGAYEIRVRRTTSDSDSSRISDLVGWTALRSITNEDPIAFPFPLAKTALIIKATDQLNSIVDELNATVSSYVSSYSGSPAWAEAVSSNPADLFRHVLQGNANARALADSRVDIDTLQDWATFCDTNGFEFNMIRDFQASVWDTLADIASAGRASPAQVDGKWSVVYDHEQTAPVQHFTPRNSWGFEAEKNFPDQPDAFRIRFANRDMDWRQDERIVYADGFTEATAENYDSLDAPGITDPDHIWKFGRFNIAQASLRPERWSLNVDFEYLVARRGDLCVITHDVLLVGLASGRIKEVLTGGSPALITGFVSDETLTMSAGTDYGVSIRTVAGQVTKQIVTSAGDQTTVMFTTPFALGTIAVDDLFGFGTLGNETIEAILASIEPAGELSAALRFYPASPAVYTSDTGTIPAFDTKLTAIATVPTATIVNVRSDESVLELGSGNTLIPHIAVSILPVDDARVVLDVQIRASGTGENYQSATVTAITGSDYLLGNVQQGNSYDVRVRWRDAFNERMPGTWVTFAGHRVVGQTNPPAGLTGATISVFGGSALIRWDQPDDLDVRFGGEVRFRHSPESDTSLVEWQSSTSIGNAANAETLLAQLPLKPGTYLARVYDKGGRPSDTVTVLATKQASVLTFAPVDTVTESTAFLGTHSNTLVTGGTLTLKGTGLFDDIADFDAMPDLDSYGGIAATGTYTFAGGIDTGAVGRHRLTSQVDATSINVLDRIDDRTGLIDTWEDFDGTTQSAADCRVYVRQTDDDPAGSPTWSVWNVLDSAEFQARAYQFKAVLTTNDTAFNIRVDTLAVVCEEL